MLHAQKEQALTALQECSTSTWIPFSSVMRVRVWSAKVSDKENIPENCFIS